MSQCFIINEKPYLPFLIIDYDVCAVGCNRSVRVNNQVPHDYFTDDVSDNFEPHALTSA